VEKYINILGIESSCDDTGIAIVNSEPKILSNIVISQNQEHKAFRGVVPEIAARAHMSNLEKALKMALDESGLTLSDIDAIAATSGPGLIGGVITGSMFAKSLCSVMNKPFIAINHLEGHALTPRLTDNVQYPYLLLLASGGHCQFVAVQSLGRYKILGQTLDDAIGEAFDKVAKMMGMDFPGGPEIERIAKNGDSKRFKFPRPLMGSNNCDMSFSGLKTAVRLEIVKIGKLSEEDKCDVAASFQATVIEVITKKIAFAIKAYEELCNGKSIVIAGGVAANMSIRGALEQVALSHGYKFIAPPIKLCTDNGAMIAFAGLERFKAGLIDDLSFKPRARWSLEDLGL